jgi:antitoxin MazE
MKAKVAKWGNSLAVRLPKGMVEELGLKPGATVDLSRKGTAVEIETRPMPKIPVYRLEDLLAQIKPGTKPPPLEDWSAVEPPWPDDDWSGIAPTDDGDIRTETARRNEGARSNASRRRKRS